MSVQLPISTGRTAPAVLAGRGQNFVAPKVRTARILLGINTANGPQYKRIAGISVLDDGSIMVFPSKVLGQAEWAYGTVYEEGGLQVAPDLLNASDDPKVDYHATGALKIALSGSKVVQPRWSQAPPLLSLDGEQIFSIVVTQAASLPDADLRKSDVVLSESQWPASLTINMSIMELLAAPSWQASIPAQTGTVLPVPLLPNAFLLDLNGHLPNKYLLVTAGSSDNLWNSRVPLWPSVSVSVPNIGTDGRVNPQGTAAMWTKGIGKVNVNSLVLPLSVMHALVEGDGGGVQVVDRDFATHAATTAPLRPHVLVQARLSVLGT